MPHGTHLNEDENLQLIRRIRQQDEAALAMLYRKFSGALLTIIHKRLHDDRQRAEEVLQDVFVRIWEKAEQYDAEKGRLFTWMANIARNAAIDYLRSADFRRQKKTDELENLVGSNTEPRDTDDLADPGLQRIVGSLEEKYRKLIELLYFRGHTQSETSQLLQMPLGTVKTRTRQAIKQLRVLLHSDFTSKE